MCTKLSIEHPSCLQRRVTGSPLPMVCRVADGVSGDGRGDDALVQAQLPADAPRYTWHPSAEPGRSALPGDRCSSHDGAAHAVPLPRAREGHGRPRSQPPGWQVLTPTSTCQPGHQRPMGNRRAGAGAAP